MKKIIISLLVLAPIFTFPQKANTGLKIGDKAPELVYNNPKGEKLKLSQVKNKIVLIDFWASWCAPCRRENPNIVSAYKKHKDTRFKEGNVSGFKGGITSRFKVGATSRFKRGTTFH